MLDREPEPSRFQKVSGSSWCSETHRPETKGCLSIVLCRIVQVQSDSVVNSNGLLSASVSTKFLFDLSQGSDLATQGHSPSHPSLCCSFSGIPVVVVMLEGE